jgi:hypothetical protein
MVGDGQLPTYVILYTLSSPKHFKLRVRSRGWLNAVFVVYNVMGVPEWFELLPHAAMHRVKTQLFEPRGCLQCWSDCLFT